MLALTLLVPICFAASPAALAATPAWAPPASATIHPGVQAFTGGAQCTTNFIFFDDDHVYIGQAAHCSGTGESTEVDGCTSGVQTVGTQVQVTGASMPGTIVYNSWATMQELDEQDPDACAFNDFALIRLDPADTARVNPSVPHWGGPQGINTAGTSQLEKVYSYGSSILRFGLTALSPKSGVSIGTSGNGWTHLVTTLTPGIPGDSGSAFLDSQGRALGVVSTLIIAVPGGLANGVTDLNRALEYMQAHSEFTDVQMAEGTEPFNNRRLPLGRPLLGGLLR